MPVRGERDHEMEKVIGNFIRVTRKKKKMTLIYLSEKMGVVHQQLQKYEMGHDRLTIQRFWNICHTLNPRRPIDVYMELGYVLSNEKIKPSKYKTNHGAEMKRLKLLLLLEKIEDSNVLDSLYAVISKMIGG